MTANRKPICGKACGPDMSLDYHELPEGVHGWLFEPVVTLLVWDRKYAVKLERPAYFYSRVAERWIEIPEGFPSDLLTIPWFVRWLISQSGPGRAEALHHDYLCDTRPDWCNSKMACDILEEGLILSAIPKRRRKAIVKGVRIGGPRF
jgi:hypothetical protein